MKTLSTLLPIALCVVCALAGNAVAQSNEEHPATRVAKAYMERMKANKVAEAVNECWDVDALMTASFGIQYLELPEKEKAATRRAYANFIAAFSVEPKFAHALSKVIVQNPKVTMFSDSLVIVTFEFDSDDGRFKDLLLNKTGETWKIVDQREAPVLTMRSFLVLMYADGAQGRETIARVLERNAAEMLKKTAAMK